MTQIQTYGTVNGISRIGDLLRQYMFPWLAFYAVQGNPADKVLFITIASLVQAIPSLTLGNYSARLVRRFSPVTTTLWSNAGMGIVSLATAFAVYLDLTNKWVVMAAWFLVGCLEVLYYPSRDCLYRALAGTDDAARADANRSAASIYHVGRALISIAMIGVVMALGPVADEIPRSAIAVALLIDAVSFAIVVAFLCSLKGVQGTEREDVGAQRISLIEAAKVRGAFPVFLCILMLWAFAYSSFYFIFGFYQELQVANPQDRQLTFYIAMFASACGGFFGAKVWKLNLSSLALGMVTVCFVEACVAFMPLNHFWGTVFAATISFVSILVYTSVFDGIIPQLVQGLEKNAEVSSAIAIVKEGLSPVIVVGLSGLASYLNAPREILIGACALSVVVVLITLTSRKEAIEDVIRRSISIRE
jgi:hypothetical protein